MMDFNYPPIQIISQHNDTVTFSASQMWSKTSVCAIAIDFVSPSNDERCDSKDHVPPGQFGYYTALCVDGVATATIYVQDEAFGDTNSVDSIPGLCAPIQAGKFTIEYTFSIPCIMEGSDCPVPQYPVCDGTDNMLVASEDYEGVEALTWLYGTESHSREFGIYLGSGEDATAGIEVTKSLPVPVGSNALRFARCV
jgi:hypothetical protein